jgi:hypothetical protein
MKRNQLTITYPTKDAADLQKTLQHLKATQHLNLSAFCRAAIAEKLQRHLKQEIK